MRIKEERVRSPGEGFRTYVEVLVAWRERDVPIILSLEVFLMLSVFGFNLLYPEVTSSNCRETKVEADLTPEVGGVLREIQ